ncbi:hypothetical protein MBANPS3_012140 [Mucor bainieri]
MKADFPSRKPQLHQEEQPPQREHFPLTRSAIRDSMHQQIQDLKLGRDHFNQQVATMKRELARQQMILHRQRKGLDIEPPEEPPAQLTPTIKIAAERYLSHEKAENVRLDSALHQSPNMRFCGTDNGTVMMTETGRFNMQRFRFHLKLVNTFESLEGLTDEEATSDTKHMPQVQQ